MLCGKDINLITKYYSYEKELFVFDAYSVCCIQFDIMR